MPIHVQCRVFYFSDNTDKNLKHKPMFYKLNFNYQNLKNGHRQYSPQQQSEYHATPIFSNSLDVLISRKCSIPFIRAKPDDGKTSISS